MWFHLVSIEAVLFQHVCTLLRCDGPSIPKQRRLGPDSIGWRPIEPVRILLKR